MKLAATLFNNIAVALVVTGVIVPVVALAYRTAVPHIEHWYGYAALWLVLAILNHQIARTFLRRLRP